LTERKTVTGSTRGSAGWAARDRHHPIAADLAGVDFTGTDFAAGYTRALRITALIAAACLPLATWTLAAQQERQPMHTPIKQ